MKKKLFITLFLLIILLANLSFASYSTVTMTVVEEPICSIELGKIQNSKKKLISKDLKNKEVTLQLQITNEEKDNRPTGEIMLVIDNSKSMDEDAKITKSATENPNTRRNLVLNASQKLVSKLLKDNKDLKMGVVSFSSNPDSSKEGSLSDAKLESALTNDLTSVSNSISNIETYGPRTDLEAGLELANQQFSKDALNKYIIVLTDGVPNIAVDYNEIYYSDTVIAKTKQKILDLNNGKVHLTTMLTVIEDESYVPAGISKNFGTIISEIFGTPEKPTAGNFYYITDEKIEETITEDIYNSLLTKSKTFKDITVFDYFPEEIIKNFDFAYVTEANIGNISAKVDTSSNSITWTIPELAPGQTATVQYKLKLKENFDSNIVDKILNTNKKVDITYKDFEDKEQSKTSDVSPKIKLTEPPAELPKAGIPILIGFTVLAAGLFIFSLVKLAILNKNTK